MTDEIVPENSAEFGEFISQETTTISPTTSQLFASMDLTSNPLQYTYFQSFETNPRSHYDYRNMGYSIEVESLDRPIPTNLEKIKEHKIKTFLMLSSTVIISMIMMLFNAKTMFIIIPIASLFISMVYFLRVLKASICLESLPKPLVDIIIS